MSLAGRARLVTRMLAGVPSFLTERRSCKSSPAHVRVRSWGSHRPPEAQGTCEQALAVIEVVRQHVVESGIENQPLAAEPASLDRQDVEQTRTEPGAAPVRLGHQIVDVEEFAVDQVHLDPIAGECDRFAIAPGGENAIAGFTL